jgi:hypothetical protein
VDVAAYTKALVSYAEQIGDVTSLENERDALFARLTNGADGKTLENSTINGKSFGWKVTITLEEKFRAFVEAIKILKNAAGDSPITFLDFSKTDRSPSVTPPTDYSWPDWPY